MACIIKVHNTCVLINELTGTSQKRNGMSTLAGVSFFSFLFGVRKYARHRNAVMAFSPSSVKLKRVYLMRYTYLGDYISVNSIYLHVQMNENQR